MPLKPPSEHIAIMLGGPDPSPNPTTAAVSCKGIDVKGTVDPKTDEGTLVTGGGGLD